MFLSSDLSRLRPLPHQADSRLLMFNRTTVLILIAAVAAGLGLWSAQRWLAPGASPQPQMQTVRLFPQTRPITPFTLKQSDGSELTAEELRGHWTLLFLGFTHCPDICPTTLAELSQSQKQWAALPAETRPLVLFVSVDPERDSPARTGEYAHYFSPDTLAATAEIPTLEALARSLGMVFMKVPLPGGKPGDYTVDHSATLALLDPQGRMAGIVRPPLQPKTIGEDLAKLAESQ